MTRKTAKVGGAVTTYEYDAENKLVRVVSPSNTANYRYDGLGRRVEKEVINVATTTTRYVYDNEVILLELNGSNAIVARYTHGPGIDEPLIMEKNAQSFYYHADGLGSITEITSQSGAVGQRYTYSSFGKIESQLDANFAQPYTFTAREFDPETDIYFYRHRTYDWRTGRFHQEDPILHAGNPRLPYALPLLLGDPLTLHGHVYVKNNPANFRDPLGLQAQTCFNFTKFAQCMAGLNREVYQGPVGGPVAVVAIGLATCAAGLATGGLGGGIVAVVGCGSAGAVLGGCYLQALEPCPEPLACVPASSRAPPA